MNRNMTQSGGTSGSDIVTSMVNEMGLTPSRAEYIQNQQGQPLNMQQHQGMMPAGMDGQDYPESQLEMMESAARGTEPEPYHQQPSHAGHAGHPGHPGHPGQSGQRLPEASTHLDEQEYEDEEEQEEQEEVKPESMFDRLLRYVKTPIVVALLFVLFSLPYTNTVFQQILPAVLLGNSTYYLLVKTVLIGISFALVHLAIE